MTTAKKIVDRLEFALGATSAPCRLVSAIESELAGHFGLSALDAAERAENVRGPVEKIIESRRVEADQHGVSAVLVIIGATGDTVAGACYVLPTDDATVAAAKVGRVHHATLLAKIRSLSFAEFETFGKKVLKELGAENPQVTPHGGDQGIDFFGSFSLGSLHGLPQPFLKLAHDVRLLFAGQAKHYPTATLGPNIVRELIGAVSLARTKTFSTDGLDIFKDLAIRPFSPVVALLFTTGHVSKGAYRLAASAGIVAKNGDQLAAFLADRGIGMTAAIPPTFNASLFDDWLAA